MVTWQDVATALYLRDPFKVRAVSIRKIYDELDSGKYNPSVLSIALETLELRKDDTDIDILKDLMAVYGRDLSPKQVDKYASLPGREGAIFRDLYLDYGRVDEEHINLDKWIDNARICSVSYVGGLGNLGDTSRATKILATRNRCTQQLDLYTTMKNNLRMHGIMY